MTPNWPEIYQKIKVGDRFIVSGLMEAPRWVRSFPRFWRLLPARMRRLLSRKMPTQTFTVTED